MRNGINQELQHAAEEDGGEIEKLMNAWAKKYEEGKCEETATQIRKEISQEIQHQAEEEDDEAEEDDEIEQLMNAWAEKYDEGNCEETKTQGEEKQQLDNTKKQEDETETRQLTEQWREKNASILTPDEEELRNQTEEKKKT